MQMNEPLVGQRCDPCLSGIYRNLSSIPIPAIRLHLMCLQPTTLPRSSARRAQIEIGAWSMQEGRKRTESLQGLHVTAAPNDSGLTVGGSWAIVPPNQWQPLQYAALLKRCDCESLWGCSPKFCCLAMSKGTTLTASERGAVVRWLGFFHWTGVGWCKREAHGPVLAASARPAYISISTFFSLPNLVQIVPWLALPRCV